MVASNRISAFDVILPRPIPFKGQVLNQIAALTGQGASELKLQAATSLPLPPAIRAGLPSELLQKVVGGPLDVSPYLRYLTRKYTDIYGLA